MTGIKSSYHENMRSFSSYPNYSNEESEKRRNGTKKGTKLILDISSVLIALFIAKVKPQIIIMEAIHTKLINGFTLISA